MLSHSAVSYFFETLWIVARQAPLSMECFRQKYWNELPFPPPLQADSLPAELSHQRRALALEPEIIVMDEATSALDVSVQETVIELITKLQREKDITIGFICHNLGLIQSFAHQIAVMYLGNIVEVMPGEGMADVCCHPYSKALLDAVFDTKMDFSKKIELIKGEAPSPLDVPAGCPFQDRCEHCMEICRQEKPVLTRLAPDHEVACHLFAKGESV